MVQQNIIKTIEDAITEGVLKNTIYSGNCLEIMRFIKDESIDCVITSPPYDNLREYKGYSFSFEKIAKIMKDISPD